MQFNPPFIYLSFIVLTKNGKSLCRINERKIPSIVTDSPNVIANLTVPKLPQTSNQNTVRVLFLSKNANCAIAFHYKSFDTLQCFRFVKCVYLVVYSGMDTFQFYLIGYSTAS